MPNAIAYLDESHRRRLGAHALCLPGREGAALGIASDGPVLLAHAPPLLRQAPARRRTKSGRRTSSAWAYGHWTIRQAAGLDHDRRPHRLPQQLLPLPYKNEGRRVKPLRRAGAAEGNRGAARGLSGEQIHRLLDVVPATLVGLRDRAIILTLVFTGRRRAEVLGMTAGSISVEGEVVFYSYRGKGGKAGNGNYQDRCLGRSCFPPYSRRRLPSPAPPTTNHRAPLASTPKSPSRSSRRPTPDRSLQYRRRPQRQPLVVRPRPGSLALGNRNRRHHNRRRRGPDGRRRRRLLGVRRPHEHLQARHHRRHPSRGGAPPDLQRTRRPRQC